MDEADLMRAKQRVILEGHYGSELIASWQPSSKRGGEGSGSKTYPFMALPQGSMASS